jgi:AbiV family abortive infection protein
VGTTLQLVTQVGSRNLHYPDMSRSEHQPPKPWDQLFDNLFARHEERTSIERISEGLRALVSNASRLLEDVKSLQRTARYSSSAFLLTTADEEMAKCYILLDMCRLDFSRHQSVLKRLCRAFYNHVAKYTYMDLVRNSDIYRSMDQVKYNWDVQVIKWWPGDVERGEPDMPHDTYFGREMPLYVDFIDVDQRWSIPNNDSDKIYFFEEFLGESKLTKSEASFLKLKDTQDAGLLGVDALTELHEVFKNQYCNESTSTETILRLYEDTATRIKNKSGIPVDVFYKSVLKEWPLYHFV